MHNKNFILPEIKEKLDCTLVNCGHENTVSTNYNFHGLRRGQHEHAIWQYTLSGYGIFDFGGVKQNVMPGEAFIAIVPENHCYYFPKSSCNWEFIYLTFTGKNSIKLFREYRQRYGAVIHYNKDSDVVKNAWEIFNNAQTDKISNAYQVSSFAYNFIMQMFCESRFDNEIANNSPPWVQIVKEYCAKNVSADIMIEDLARMANCSKWHFSRQFTLYEGVSPHRYLMNLRLKLALQLLENSTFSIKEIAEKCGFYDLAYFGKIFKSRMNISPREYRK